MTVTPSGPGTDVQPFDPNEFGNVGMEDIGVGDLVIPRLRIVHAEGVFEDNLTKQKFSKLQVILLGLVKQRIMWDDDVQEGDRPQCKSPDGDLGFPQMRKDIPAAKQFPWQASNFNEPDFPPNPEYNNLIALPCESCVFSKWVKNPRTGKNDPPPCSEQHTFPLKYSADEGETWTTAIVTFQRTGIKPSKSYISSFVQSSMPMFTAVTELSLSIQTRGSVTFSVPVLKRMGATDRGEWRNYADTYRQIRSFLRTPPRNNAEDDSPPAVSNNENVAPAQPVVVQQPASPSTEAAAPVPAPAQPAAVQEPAVQQAPPQQAAPPTATPPPSDLPF